MISKTIIVPGEAKGKARPRTVWRNGFVQTFTPKASRDYEAKIRKAYKMQANYKFEKGTPVKMNLIIYVRVPKSYTKAKTEMAKQNQIRPLKKPDIDNIVKSVLDALNGVAYEDDCQVVELKCKKIYDSEDKIEITLEEIVW